jgi:hypothetical protein
MRATQASGVLVALMVCLSALAPIGQSGQSDPRHAVLDQILDLYVRDGYVYYRALRQERSRLDGYLNALAVAPVDAMPRDERLAFWLNAYNALVLETVIDHYPMGRRSSDYPPGSIRQIPGAFERTEHRVGHMSLTLDQIEQTILPAFQDPRVYLGLGRGAVDSGRLRSEAFTGAGLERQLAEAARECASGSRCVRIDTLSNTIQVSSIFSWREKEFSAAYAHQADAAFGNRSAIERAVLAFVTPRLLGAERDFVARNEFQVRYLPFDWTLNDLTGR